MRAVRGFIGRCNVINVTHLLDILKRGWSPHHIPYIIGLRVLRGVPNIVLANGRIYNTSKRHNRCSKFALPVAMHFLACPDARSMHGAWPPDAPTAISMYQYSLHVNSIAFLALLSSAISLVLFWFRLRVSSKSGSPRPEVAARRMRTEEGSVCGLFPGKYPVYFPGAVPGNNGWPGRESNLGRPKRDANATAGGRGGVAVRLLASHLGELVSNPDGVAPGISHVADGAAGRRVFSGISRFPRPCIPAPPHTHLASPSPALKTSMLRAEQITPLHSDTRPGGRTLIESNKASATERSALATSTKVTIGYSRFNSVRHPILPGNLERLLRSRIRQDRRQKKKETNRAARTNERREFEERRSSGAIVSPHPPPLLPTHSQPVVMPPLADESHVSTDHASATHPSFRRQPGLTAGQGIVSIKLILKLCHALQLGKQVAAVLMVMQQVCKQLQRVQTAVDICDVGFGTGGACGGGRWTSLAVWC
ncbi:hypothetical protein PR048_031231 [Dryococelus australis]|uniref:Uncharacterized protein n=1 Tax=Dryococelus australis TaxID=614101 RepID=A0ABQ9G4P3_9NEOP|nr:hypothetical protein PR048_031231 [Dryococelus australis]